MGNGDTPGAVFTRAGVASELLQLCRDIVKLQRAREQLKPIAVAILKQPTVT